MINTLNVGTVSDTQTSTLVDRLVKKADVNGDGSVTTAEFARFLTDLLNTAGSSSTSVAKAATTAATLAPCPRGWDPEKWTNLEHQSPKYVVGRILANYAPTPAGLQQALAGIQTAMPGTTLVGDDKLDIPGVGLIDVGVRFKSGGGVGWAWQVVE